MDALAKGKSEAVEAKVDVVENLAERMSRVIKHLNGIARRSDYAVKDLTLDQALEPVASLFERRLEESSVALKVRTALRGFTRVLSIMKEIAFSDVPKRRA